MKYTIGEERWGIIDQGLDKLTKKELAEGWHFCYDWDEMLVGPGMVEYEYCNCR